jgi:hypothetical protein
VVTLVRAGATPAEAAAKMLSEQQRTQQMANEIEVALDAFDRAAKALDRAAGRLEQALIKFGVSVQSARVQQVRASVLLAGQRIDDLIERMDGKQ